MVEWEITQCSQKKDWPYFWGALVEALETGEIWGAALDVWEKEPLDPNDPLCKFEKVMTTSHLGAATRETVIRCFSIGYENIMNDINNKPLINIVDA